MAKTKEINKENEVVDQIDSILNSKEAQGKHYGSRSGADILAQTKITTGSFFFDYVLGGGFRSGSWGRFWGHEESGKTSMGLCWAKNWQKTWGDKGFVLYINAESRLTKDLLDRSEVNTHKDCFRIIDSNNADFCYDLIEKLLLNNTEKKKYFVMFDSTDAAIRNKDMEKEIGEAEKIGGSATINSAAGKRLSILFNKNDHFLYLTSQVRDKVNTYSPGAPGKDASGGNAPRFYSSLIGEFKKPWSERYILQNPAAKQDNDNPIIGRMVEIRLHKTPNEKTNATVLYPVKYGLKGGVWRAYEAMMVATAWDYYTEKGAWTSIVERRVEEFKQNNIPFESKFQGKKQMIDYFESQPKLVDYILDKTRELAINPPVVVE